MKHFIRRFFFILLAIWLPPSPGIAGSVDVSIDGEKLFRAGEGSDGKIDIYPKFKKTSEDTSEEGGGPDADDGTGGGGIATRVKEIFKQKDGSTQDDDTIWSISPVEGQDHLLQITDTENQHSVIISVPENVSWNYEDTASAMSEESNAPLPAFSIFNALCDPQNLDLIHQLLQQPPVTSWWDRRACRCFGQGYLDYAGLPTSYTGTPSPQAVEPNNPWHYEQSQYQVEYSMILQDEESSAGEGDEGDDEGEDANEEKPKDPQNVSTISLAISAMATPSSASVTEPEATYPVIISLLNAAYTNNLYTPNPETSEGGGGSGTSKYIVIARLQNLFSSGKEDSSMDSFSPSSGSSPDTKTDSMQDALPTGLALAMLMFSFYTESAVK